MKTLFFKNFLLILLIGFISFSCASTPNDAASKFDPKALVGTKWVEIDPSPGFTFTLEFEDNRFCLWSFQGIRIRMEYTVTGNTITLANKTSYVVNGNILLEVNAFSKKPFFTKA